MRAAAAAQRLAMRKLAGSQQPQSAARLPRTLFHFLVHLEALQHSNVIEFRGKQYGGSMSLTPGLSSI